MWRPAKCGAGKIEIILINYSENYKIHQINLITNKNFHKNIFIMNIDQRIVERARRLRESGPSVEDKRWMAQQVIEGRISAYKMAKLSRIGYSTVRRIRDYVATDHFLKGGSGRPTALDDISLGRIRTMKQRIASNAEVAKTTEEWRDIIRNEYENSRRRRYPLEIVAHMLSQRSMKRYMVVVENMLD